MIELKSLSISRSESWQSDAGKLRGVITFNGSAGEVRLNLNEELSRQIVHLCSGQIADSAKEIAENMIAETIESSIEEQKAITAEAL